MIENKVFGLFPVAAAGLGQAVGEALRRRPDVAREGAAGGFGRVERLLRVDGTRDAEAVVVGARPRHGHVRRLSARKRKKRRRKKWRLF